MDVRNGYLDAEGAASFLLRLGLGVLFFTAGLTKFILPGGARAMSEMMRGQFADTWLPGFLTTPFLVVLPYVEVPLGVLLVLGIGTRYFLTLAGLLLVALSFGMLVKMDAVTASNNLMYVFMAGVALWMAGKSNPYSLDGIFNSWKGRSK